MREARPHLLGKTGGSIRDIPRFRSHHVARFLPGVYGLVTSQRSPSSSHGGIEDIHQSGTESDAGYQSQSSVHKYPPFWLFRDFLHQFGSLFRLSAARCNIGLSDNSDDFVFAVDNRHPTGLAFFHGIEATLEIIVLAAGYRTASHHLFDSSVLRVATLCQHFQRQVPIGDHADQVFRSKIFYDWNRTNIFAFHQLGGLRNTILRCTANRISSHDFPDLFHDSSFLVSDPLV